MSSRTTYTAELIASCLLTLLITVIALAVTASAAYWIEDTTCTAKLEVLQVSGGYDFFAGCYIETDTGKRILLENYRAGDLL